MVLIEEITEEEKAMLESRGSTSRFAMSVIEEFKTSGLKAAKIVTEKNPQQVGLTLRKYIKDNELPYKVSTRRGDIFIMIKEEAPEKELTEAEVDAHA